MAGPIRGWFSTITHPAREPASSPADMQDTAPPPSRPEVRTPSHERHRFMALLSRNKAAGGKDKPAMPNQDMIGFRDHKLDIAFKMLKQRPDLFHHVSHKELEAFRKDVSSPFGKKELKTFEDRLLNWMAGHMKTDESMKGKRARITLRVAFRRAMVESLNESDWNTIHRSFYHRDHFYHSEMIPAAQMKHGEHGIFENDYQGKGVCSGSTECTDHATNLWISEFAASKPGDALDRQKETVLFRGVRHGILSPYGLRAGEGRKAGAVSRAKEVVAAALYAQNSEELKQAMASPWPGRVKLRLTSTSLVTAANFGKVTEGKQLADQLHAWDTLHEKPFILKMRNEKGEIKDIEVELDVAAFNFGVNEATLMLSMGWKDSDKRNDQSLKMLLGPELEPGAPDGGWVGDYLAANPDAPNAALVRDLSSQIREIWDKGHHRRDLGEPYKMTQRVALLSHEIGVVPCYNCKSGKDRTAMLDGEIKREAARLHGGEALSKPGARLSENDRELFRKVLEAGGNQEIQRQNTGAPGNKVLVKRPRLVPTLSFGDRMDPEVLKRARGLSGHVRS